MKDENSSLGTRFAEERTQRLKLSQAAVAEKCGVSREMIGKYERDVATPGGDVLAEFGKLGADLYYILVGHKRDAPQPVILQPDEVLLIDGYRSLPDADKSWFSDMLAARVLTTAQSGANKYARKKVEPGHLRMVAEEKTKYEGSEQIITDNHGQIAGRNINNPGRKKK